METKVSHRKKRSGVVVSNAADKTIVVRVTRMAKHPLYRKLIKINKKYHAHDEKNIASVGDVVNIIECRPLSKTKRWRLQSVVEGKKA
jgi:small subunit ribosomal protein S17